ncbi:MAG: hypothetical protein JO002_03905 [Burkholderiaceae bacterium]|nr:hypothetical protein [Burkholderiaceae bacterium]
MRVHAVRLHYVTAGPGAPRLFGRPQRWVAWRSAILLPMALGRQVITLDLLDLGDGDEPCGGGGDRNKAAPATCMTFRRATEPC